MTRDDMMKLLQECGFGTLTDHPIMTENMMRFAALVAEREREACAKVAESFDPNMRWSNYGVHIANTIRARGEKTDGLPR